SYEQRRAGLREGDERADDELLDLLRIVGRDPSGAFLPARVLTPAEKELHREGTLANAVKGEIVTQAVARELEQARLGKVRAQASTKAAKAEAEARRLKAEAQRLRGDSSA